MADHYNAFIVILDKDIRDEHAETTINAIRQIKGVLDVKPNISGDIASMVEVSRVSKKLAERFQAIQQDLLRGEL